MPPFRFQKFSVNDDGAAMKVGTDGILLGAWCKCAKANRILDVGTGCGLIALILAQRSERTKPVIQGVEIDLSAAEQARENFQASPWADRLSVTHQTLQKFAARSESKFDMIACNPPFFKEPNVPNPESNSPRKVARHETTLSKSELVESAKNLLAKDGTLSLILPFDQCYELIQLATDYGLTLQRQTNVRPLPNRAFNRVLLEFNPAGDSKIQSDELTIETAHHQYTQDFESLTSELYLRFQS